MIKKIIAAVVLIALLTVAIVQAMEKQTVDNLPGLKIGLKAPNFELLNLDGEKVKLSDYEGKKIILNFWATWCPPCKAEMPNMEQYYASAPEDVVILAVNIDPQYDVKEFVEEMGVTFPILLDEEDQVNSVYQVLSIPTTYFIDKKGLISHKIIGAMSLETMEDSIKDME